MFIYPTAASRTTVTGTSSFLRAAAICSLKDKKYHSGKKESFKRQWETLLDHFYVCIIQPFSQVCQKIYINTICYLVIYQ